MKLLNAFSIQMTGLEFAVESKEISKEEAAEILKTQGCESAIGHLETAQILTKELGIEVPFNRSFVTIAVGESVVIAQLVGGRLPEKVTTLPEGMTFKFALLTRTK